MNIRHHRLSSSVAGSALLVAVASTLGFVAPTATAADTTTARAAGDPAQLVVKVRNADGCSIKSLDSRYPLVIDSPVLASRGIYQVHGSDAKYQTEAGAEELATSLSALGCVNYAEPDADLHLADTQFHSWQFHSWGGNSDKASGSGNWKEQAAVKQLALTDAQRASQGAGVTVAVLDTGIDASHPAFDGRIARGGYDYVSDDSDPSDVATGADTDGDGYTDTAVGHGTFAAGLVTLVAPSARVMPMRVLDSDGNGNLFVIAQAIWEAADAGAQVINLSFGTDSSVKSSLLTNAIKNAYKRGSVVVAAAGNSGTSTPTYPASLPEVLSVGALSENATSLASFSNRGSWVAVAAPGTNVIGPIPGNRYSAWSGTSMAAPLVAGQVALIAAIDGLSSSAKSDGIVKLRASYVTSTARALPETKSGIVDLIASLKKSKQG